jgi:hypothetical protein
LRTISPLMSTLRFANGFSTTGDSFLHLLLVLYFA